MSNAFFTADLHLGHKNLLSYEAANRPFKSIEEHDAELIRRWNARVGKRDVVWILGDFAWNVGACANALDRLTGRKRLILGDHDQRWFTPVDWSDDFELVSGCEKWKDGVVLTHMPVAFDGFKYTRNIHGHTHSHMIYREIVDWDQRCTREGEDEDPRYCCVSVEQTDLAPISWDEIRSRKNW